MKNYSQISTRAIPNTSLEYSIEVEMHFKKLFHYIIFNNCKESKDDAFQIEMNRTQKNLDVKFDG